MDKTENKTIDVLIDELERLKKKNNELLFLENERLSIEKALRESEIKYKDLFDNAPVGYHELNSQGIIMRVNRTELNMLGYDEAEMLNRPYWDFIPEEESEKSRKSFQSKISGAAKQGHGFERKYQRKDGSIVLFSTYDRLEFDSDGKITGICSTVQDITEKKEAEEKLQQYAEELRESNATKDKFFSIIAHDLKSPFLGLLGLTGILADEFDKLDLKEIKIFANDIAAVSKKIYQFLENLLTWSRLQVGKMEFNPVEIDLYKTCEDIKDLLVNNAKNKNIELVFDIMSDLKVQADENMIRSVMENLISNSIKYTPKGGKVLVSSLVTDHTLGVCITDTGIGIKEEDLAKLFRIDIQHSTKGTANEMGTGLGLLLCKEMIEKHNGSIGVESHFGKGSKFYFTLPLN
jgi:PAS domain S-box-containing protein